MQPTAIFLIKSGKSNYTLSCAKFWLASLELHQYSLDYQSSALLIKLDASDLKKIISY